MSTAQTLTFHPGSANYIAITNVGGLRNSIQYTSTVGLAANQTLNSLQEPAPNFACKTSPNIPGTSTIILCAYGSKMVAVNSATAGAQSLSNLFSVLSTITILAGVVLIINMFIMLAEERKSEMGMARAVGMKRGQLTKLFLFEGTLYAAGASLIGIFVGIGIAYGILYAFGKIISNFFPVSLAQVLDSFTFIPTSLFTAFTEGLFITYLTILLALYNTDVILRILRVFYQGRKRLTVIFKTALSYPGNKRFRTGATVAMFALVLLSVTTIAFLTAEQSAALDKIVAQQSGGYDIVTRTTLPVADLASRIGTDKALSGKVAAVIPFNSTGVTVKDLTSGIPLDPQPAVGGDPNAPSQSNFYTGNTFTMALMANGYKTATDVWKSVTAKNSSDIVWSFGSVNFNGPPTASRTPDVGDLLQLYYHPNSTTVLSKNVTVAGVLNGVFFNGIVGTSQLLKNAFGIGTGTLGFVKVHNGVDPTSVANILKKDFAHLGMQTIAIAAVVSTFIQIGQSFLGIFEAFLALGLVVGIAGLGIISIRSVVERRKEIGVLRAMGYRKNMILAAFVLENSYVALLGILIGIVLGIDLGYAIATSPGSGLSFVIPWVSLLEIIAFSYGLAVLATLSSSRRAARIPPADTLRYTE